jgi:putative phosphoribosyl transferase
MNAGSNVSIPSGAVMLQGVLELPQLPFGVVVFSHGSGSGRNSPRNRAVARVLRETGLATLLVDLLTSDEDADYHARFDIDLLTRRLYDAVHFVRSRADLRALPVGLFGASTGAASALRVAAALAHDVKAVVSRGGRPDLAGAEALAQVAAPTLLIVGGADAEVIELNRVAHTLLRCEKALAIVRGATHLFEEPGALEEVAGLASEWFLRHLSGGVGRSRGEAVSSE